MTRFHLAALSLVSGILIGLALYDGCAAPEVVEHVRTQWKTNTVTKIERKEVEVPRAYAVVKWRDRIVRPQLDTTAGRRDTVLLSEEFAAQFSGRDSSNGGTVSGWVRSHPLRVEDLLVNCPPDTSTRAYDTMLVETVRQERPSGALGVGLYAGVDHELRLRYGVGVSLSYILGSW
jgi:hypothetical protein